MPKNRGLKRRVRARMAKTGESYTAARHQIIGTTTAGDIIRAVADVTGFKVEDLTGPRRERGLVTARQLAMLLLTNELHLDPAEVGELLGGRMPHLVRHAVDKMAVVTARSPELTETDQPRARSSDSQPARRHRRSSPDPTGAGPNE